jgi:hypothetical protein
MTEGLYQVLKEYHVILEELEARLELANVQGSISDADGVSYLIGTETGNSLMSKLQFRINDTKRQISACRRLLF